MADIKTFVVIGAGLAGSVITNKLSKKHNVVVLEREHGYSLEAVDYDIKLKRSVGFGLGGTTKLWHNALIRIDERFLSSNWIERTNLHPWYDKAERLFNMPPRSGDTLRSGLNISSGEAMYVPKHRLNMWDFLKCRPKQIFFDEPVSFLYDGSRIAAVKTRNGRVINCDHVIDCSGGLGVLQTIPTLLDKWEPHGYEDHLCGYIGKLTFKSFRKSLTTRINGKWTRRIPLIFRATSGYPIAMYLRPTIGANSEKSFKPRQVLSQIRNGPNRADGIIGLLKNIPELTEAIASRFGLVLPSKVFSIFAVYGHPNQKGRAVSFPTKRKVEIRHDEKIVENTRLAVEALKKHLNAERSDFFENFYESLDTGAHHSSTIPMGESGDLDDNLSLRSVPNYSVCSGAVIPDSAYSNTGLTIVALSLRLSNYLMEKYD